jgi:hypothetical protein
VPRAHHVGPATIAKLGGEKLIDAGGVILVADGVSLVLRWSVLNRTGLGLVSVEPVHLINGPLVARREQRP